ncbi:MAG: LysR family transcriptional regulator [Formosimonas sp.]
MNKLKRMQIFVRAVEMGSFSATAVDQNMSPAMVGRHIAELEEMLGVTLIQRSTRAMEVTPSGWTYYHGCKDTLLQVSRLEQQVSTQQSSLSSGLIRFSCPDMLCNTPPLLNAIRTFRLSHPNVQFDLICDNNLTDLISSDVDFSLRMASTLEDSSLVGRKLATTKQVLYASADYVTANGRPKNTEDLQAHACLCFSTSRYGAVWLAHNGSTIVKIRQSWQFVTNQTSILLKAILAGFGVAPLPTFIAHEYVESGQLQEIPFHLDFPDLSIYVIYPNRDYISPRAHLFIEHLYGNL